MTNVFCVFVRSVDGTLVSTPNEFLDLKMAVVRAETLAREHAREYWVLERCSRSAPAVVNTVFFEGKRL